MNKRTNIIIAELVPVVSAILAITLIMLPFDSSAIRGLIDILTLLGFSGFVFFFISRRLGKEDRTVKILGILDLLATASIIVFYIIAILSIAM